MHTEHDIEAMARELQEYGFDAEQGARYDFAFDAAKQAVLVLLCARYGVGDEEMLDALMDSRRLAAEAGVLLERIEVSPAFIGYIHSGLKF